MVEREVAWRVFAHEFIHSDYFFHDGDERSPNYLVTPTGARVNRLYFVGVLTEIDNLNAGEDIWRARVSDPTGAFSVYAGQYQPQASVFLSGLDVPCFVAITGKARTYEPENGTIYTSVRPEELNTASDHIRDRWIVDTARLTYERIGFVRSALDSGLKGDELTAMLIQSGTSAELADGILRAVSHYTDLDKYLNTLSGVIVNALNNLASADNQPTPGTGVSHAMKEVAGSKPVDAMVKETSARYSIEDTKPVPPTQSPQPARSTEPAQPTQPTQPTQPIQSTEPEQPTQSPQPETAQVAGEEIDDGTTGSEPARQEEDKPEPDEIVYELMSIIDKGNGVPVSELVDESKRRGLTDKQVDDAVETLMSEGRCYEPRLGVLRRV
jgi:RPA family protein